MQAFYLVSRFHDHLESAPIGFTSTWGNFEIAARRRRPVQTQTYDGATIAAAAPDAAHRNNANMTTPPDGQSPKMQMYLFRDTNTPAALDWRSMNGGDDSGLVWHEYTHGLSNRLVTNADGSGALSSAALRRDGRGLERLVRLGPAGPRRAQDRRPGTPGEIDIGDYTDADLHKLRSQALDCPVNTADPLCPGGVDTAAGGYTLGDFGKIFEGPEVHADGELWAETLWDLRQAVGSDVAERLVTNGMRLRRPSRRCSTCATRSWPRSRPTAAGSTTRCGRSSVCAAWATGPPCPTATTPNRSRTSRCRPTPPAPRAPRPAS